MVFYQVTALFAVSCFLLLFALFRMRQPNRKLYALLLFSVLLLVYVLLEIIVNEAETISLYEKIQTVVAICGFWGLICSIGFLQQQTMEAIKQTRANTYQAISSRMVEIDRFFFDHPEMRQFFYDNVEISKDDPKYQRILSIAEMLMDFMDSVLMLMPYMPDFPWETTWIRYFHDLLERSPVLQEFYRSNRNWYEDQVKTHYLEPFRKILEEIKDRQASSTS